MQISIIADCHLNISIYKGVPDINVTDLPFRTVDFEKSFEEIINNNINNIKPDLIVIAGDTYDTFDPSNLVREFFNTQLRKLSEAKIPVIILVGNHDICRKHHALKPIAALGLKNVKIIESPKILKFKDKILFLFPYSMEVEKKQITIREQFHSFIKDAHAKIDADIEMKGKEILFFGHFGVRGANLNQYTERTISKKSEMFNVGDTEGDTEVDTEVDTVVTEKKNFLNKREGDISFSELDEIGASYVFLGDFHQHQVLNTKKCYAMYTGSIDKTDISEIDQKKGFILYDSDAKEEGSLGKCKFIETNGCRPMLDFRGTIKEIEEAVDKIPSGSSNGAIVRLVFVGNSDELTAFSIGLENLKKKIQIKINAIHIFHQQKVTDQEEEKEATELEQEILDKGHMESDDVIGVVSEMIREKTKEVDEQKELVDMAIDIYKSTMEAK